MTPVNPSLTDPALERQLASLSSALVDLGQAGPLDPEDSTTTSAIRERMSAILDQLGGADALVASYGADPRAAVARPLAFLLGVKVNSKDGAQRAAAATLAMVEALTTADPWPRLNLCTALQRMIMFNVVETLTPPQAAAVVKLLREGLASIPAVRATAATVVADLYYRLPGALPAGDLEDLGQRVLALVDDDDELTRLEACGLRDFLAQRAPATS